MMHIAYKNEEWLRKKKNLKPTADKKKKSPLTTNVNLGIFSSK